MNLVLGKNISSLERKQFGNVLNFFWGGWGGVGAGEVIVDFTDKDSKYTLGSRRIPVSLGCVKSAVFLIS